MKTKYALLLVAAVFVAAALTMIIYSSTVYIDKKEIAMDMQVQPGTLGFNLDPDALHFGKVPPGQSSERGLIITNNRTIPLNARLYFSGEIGGWVLPEEWQTLVEPGESREVKLTATAPSSAATGNYTGKITVLFRKA